CDGMSKRQVDARAIRQRTCNEWTNRDGSGGVADDAAEVCVGDGAVIVRGPLGMLGGADVAGRVAAAGGRLDRGDRRLLEADPTPLDEHGHRLRPAVGDSTTLR